MAYNLPAEALRASSYVAPEGQQQGYFAPQQSYDPGTGPQTLVEPQAPVAQAPAPVAPQAPAPVQPAAPSVGYDPTSPEWQERVRQALRQAGFGGGTRGDGMLEGVPKHLY